MPAVESVRCDRSVPGALDVFRSRRFDAVIDFSAYPSSWVAQAGAVLAGHVSCRLPFVLGPENYEDRESFAFSRLLAGAPILLTNGGNANHSFVYAGDVAQALLALLRTNPGSMQGSKQHCAAWQEPTDSRTAQPARAPIVCCPMGKQPFRLNYCNSDKLH